MRTLLLIFLFCVTSRAAEPAATPNAVRIVLGGDSTMSGYDQWTTEIEGGPAGDATWDAAQLITTLSGGTIWATNVGRQGWEWDQVWAQQLDYMTNAAANASIVVVRCGINNIFNDGVGTFDKGVNAVQYMNLVASNVCGRFAKKLVICEIFPQGGGGSVNIWNRHYSLWVRTNNWSTNTYLLYDHQAFGDPATGGDTLNAAYFWDTVHPNKTGIDLSVQLIINRVRELSPGPVRRVKGVSLRP